MQTLCSEESVLISLTFCPFSQAAAVTDKNVHKVEMPEIDRSQTSLRLGEDQDAS